MESNTQDHNLPKALIVSSSNEKAEGLVKSMYLKFLICTKVKEFILLLPFFRYS